MPAVCTVRVEAKDYDVFFIVSKSEHAFRLRHPDESTSASSIESVSSNELSAAVLRLDGAPGGGRRLRFNFQQPSRRIPWAELPTEFQAPASGDSGFIPGLAVT